jgi:anti-sigma-K factor RskA
MNKMIIVPLIMAIGIAAMVTTTLVSAAAVYVTTGFTDKERTHPLVIVLHGFLY